MNADHPDLLSLVRSADSDALPSLVGQLAQAQAEAFARLVAARPPVVSGNISAEEAAARMGMSDDWIYKNKGKLPFVRRIGRRVLVDAAALERWNRNRAA